MHLDGGRFLAVIAAVLFALLLFPASGKSQIANQIDFGSSPSPVGSGARAVGRGGAFISIADDATAASWNPAGLVQLEYPEVSAAGAILGRWESLEYNSSQVEDEQAGRAEASLNYLSAAYPVELWSAYLVFAMNHQRLYDFDRETKLEYHDWTIPGQNYNASGVSRDEQAGALTTISPAVAYEINYRFSIGAAVNIWNHDLTVNGWDRKTTQKETGLDFDGVDFYPYSFRGTRYQKYRLTGYNLNYHVGFLWDINDTWRVGGVYKTELAADVRHETKIHTAHFFPTDAVRTNFVDLKESSDEKLHLPPSYGLGVCYQPSDAWSFALDIYVTEWDRFFMEDEDGRRYNLLAATVGDSHIDPTTQVRLGMEYLLIRGQTVYPFRAGLFYDPEPSADGPQDVYGMSMGVGYVQKSFAIDAALQFRWGSEMDGITIADRSSDRSIFESLFLLSMIYHFNT